MRSPGRLLPFALHVRDMLAAPARIAAGGDGGKDGMMAEASGGPGGRVFICYRRGDASYPAAWLFDQLTARFGSARVFMDVDSIEPGDDFTEVIAGAVGSCAVLLAVIGDRWLAAADENGRRRLDDPGDFVRLEIEAALARGVRVIPVIAARSASVIVTVSVVPSRPASLQRSHISLMSHAILTEGAARDPCLAGRRRALPR